MAETEAAGAGLDFLKTKVGPLPLVVWMGAGLVIWLYLQKKQSTGSSTASATGATAGQIDPATGYSYGTSQDQLALANLASGSLDSSSGGGSTSTSGSTTAGAYATNQAWGEAAINYLVARGIDPTTANQAIQLWLSSQTLTSDQQADVNLVVQAIGSPPQPPAPSTTNPTPVQTSGNGTATNATNPVTGVAAGNITGTAISLKWNQAANATGYTISYGVAPNATTYTTSTGLQQDSNAGTDNAQNGITIGNLTPGTTYSFKVQATPASSGAAWSDSTTVTTSKS